MNVSWYKEARKFKSPSHVVAAFLLSSREGLRGENNRLREKLRQLKQQREQEAKQTHQHHHQQQQEIERLQQRCADLEREREQTLYSIHLPEDPSIGTHGYGPRLVSLAVELAKSNDRASPRGQALFPMFDSVILLNSQLQGEMAMPRPPRIQFPGAIYHVGQTGQTVLAKRCHHVGQTGQTVLAKRCHRLS